MVTVFFYSITPTDLDGVPGPSSGDNENDSSINGRGKTGDSSDFTWLAWVTKKLLERQDGAPA